MTFAKTLVCGNFAETSSVSRDCKEEIQCNNVGFLRGGQKLVITVHSSSSSYFGIDSTIFQSTYAGVSETRFLQIAIWSFSKKRKIINEHSIERTNQIHSITTLCFNWINWCQLCILLLSIFDYSSTCTMFQFFRTSASSAGIIIFANTHSTE